MTETEIYARLPGAHSTQGRVCIFQSYLETNYQCISIIDDIIIIKKHVYVNENIMILVVTYSKLIRAKKNLKWWQIFSKSNLK